MRTTIDFAGRLVVPKSVRDAMGLPAGKVVDVVFTDGRIEIESAPADVSVDVSGDLPRIVPADELPALSDDDVRNASEATRR
ncbi:AbrB/MazE/SpoVT family DNA-binding domain-containing protein [Nocardioides acrostichi]|uniref:AbrB/MazE/SpoVT family DNA-binding domain-containing protein n=1 Tax=Nocardioides acrostichi TaxID=2784339 RepID=A0A930UWP4_9ACTN|nr:AbrB/MazE/SpoVT family DNA-binding domain-containing protein [Nocardioides acrostichi]MBF4161531.1 AbrB/MazE/SpoVT family DNA-binding domain-containing protein [Nocardioides acrostichi]